MDKKTEVEFDTIKRNVNIHILTGIELTYPYNKIYEIISEFNCLNIYSKNSAEDNSPLFYGKSKRDIKFRIHLGWIRYDFNIATSLNKYLKYIPYEDLCTWYINNCSSIELPNGKEILGSYATLYLNSENNAMRYTLIKKSNG